MSALESEQKLFINKPKATVIVACIIFITGGSEDASLFLPEDTHDKMKKVFRITQPESVYVKTEEMVEFDNNLKVYSKNKTHTLNISDMIKTKENDKDKEQVVIMHNFNYYEKTYKLVNISSVIIFLMLLSLNFVAGNSLKGWIISIVSFLILLTINKFTNKYLNMVMR